MKIGLIADIHGNLAALEATLSALQEAKCKTILCMGDVVGYGPDPEACVTRIHELNIQSIKGNHETWVTADRTPSAISDSLRDNLRWTRSQLTPSTIRYLAALPHHATWRGIGMVHASNAPSRSWPFVRGPRRLAANFAHQKEDVCFHGHTHVPAVGLQAKANPEDTSFVDLPTDGKYQIRRNEKAFINPGSVGQPRDGDQRAAFATFQVRKRIVEFFRIPYDIGHTIKRMESCGLSKSLIQRLENGR